MNRPIINVPVKNLRKAKWNYKTEGSDEAIEKLIQSATYQRSIGIPAARELGKGIYEVIDGNHRLDAIIKLGKEEIQIENFGKISKAEAVLISKQRNTVWFEDDTIKFAELFKNDILKEFTIDELETMLPINRDELLSYNDILTFNWDQYNQNDEDNEEDIEGKVIKIIVSDQVFKLWNKWKEKLIKDDNKISDEICLKTALLKANSK